MPKKKSNFDWEKDPYAQKWIEGLAEKSKEVYKYGFNNWMLFTKISPTDQTKRRINDLQSSNPKQRNALEDAVLEFKRMLEVQGYSGKTLLNKTTPIRSFISALFKNMKKVVNWIVYAVISWMFKLRQKPLITECLKELCTFTGKPESVVKAMFFNEDLAEAAWRKRNPQSEEEILRFYAEEISTAFVDLRWNTLDPTKYKSRFKLLNFCRSSNVEMVLDYGAGVGEYCIFLSQNGFKVTYSDVYGVGWEFAEWRMQRRNVDVEMLRAGVDKLGKYDLIVCTDVLEHVKNPLKILQTLYDALNDNGFLAATFPFEVQKAQHLEENKKYAKTIKDDLAKLGFKFVSEEYFKFYQK
mgnify:CR=1 FL=1